MAKKSKKIEKETRRLMEGVADLIKRKGDGYKFKTHSKKKRKLVKKSCPHWTIYKNGKKERPTTIEDKQHPGYWRCKICGARFKIRPEAPEEYDNAVDRVIEQINQIQFWSVKMGGDKEDTEMFLKLRNQLPRFKKVAHQVVKRVNKRDEWEKNRQRSDVLSQFDAYSSFSYND